MALLDGVTAENLMGKVVVFLDRHPEDGMVRLEMFLAEDKVLIDTIDVAKMTGWTVPYINRLCRESRLPYIPGKPHKFVPASLIQGLKKLQVGGDYGRRKSRTLNRSHK